ncbi:hypothetical protein SGFS_006740 [Streptomyces graminofaciens]|uniref:Uncharacterized protein n=1 Tax=Streptomyces graminofaciens TaxID=68212 RepID=A0ABN5V7V6_9ACTN|nr:hypothetical protein SGFS_006740 [Streptomyces graminofaciens]
MARRAAVDFADRAERLCAQLADFWGKPVRDLPRPRGRMPRVPATGGTPVNPSDTPNPPRRTSTCLPGGQKWNGPEGRHHPLPTAARREPLVAVRDGARGSHTSP